MNNTAARIYSIPAEGLTHTVGTKTWELKAVGCGGYTLNIRVDGARTGGDWFQFSTNALNAWNTIVAENVAAGAIPTQRTLTAPAKGTATKMTDPEVQVIGEALESTGTIRRGRGYAAADIQSLQAMARRNFVELDHPIRPRSATVTAYGRLTYAEHVARQDEAQKTTDALNRVLAFTAA